MFTQITYHSIDDEGVTLVTRANKEMRIPAETVVFAAGQTPDDVLYTQMKDTVEHCYLIGAAKFASETNAQSAIWEASELARMI